MTNPKPTLVLVHGAYHSPAIFDPILPLLHVAGYRTTTVTLPSIGSSPGHTDNLADVKAARKVISAVVVELGHEAVVLAHSYGGMIASEAVQGPSKKERAAEGESGGVIHMVYVSSILPELGPEFHGDSRGYNSRGRGESGGFQSRDEGGESPSPSPLSWWLPRCEQAEESPAPPSNLIISRA